MPTDSPDESERLFQLGVQAAEKLCSTVRVLNTASDDEFAYKAVMLSLFSKGYKSYQAIVLLWKNGFAEDASALARTLFELMLQASWVSRDPTRRGRLCLVHESVAQYLHYQRLNTSGDDPDLVRNIENRGEQFTQLQGRFDEFKSNYAKGKKGKTFHEHWWCGSIHDLARWLGPDYLKQHARLYWTLSGYVHSDAHSF